MIFCPIMCMYISCVGLCVHRFMNPLPSSFVCCFFFVLFCFVLFFLRCFNILCYASGFYMLVFVVRCLCCAVNPRLQNTSYMSCQSFIIINIFCIRIFIIIAIIIIITSIITLNITIASSPSCCSCFCCRCCCCRHYHHCCF